MRQCRRRRRDDDFKGDDDGDFIVSCTALCVCVFLLCIPFLFAPKLFAWRSYRHDNLCHSCLASKTILDCMYTDLILESACWLDTMISHDEYIESLGDDDRCPVLDIYGFEHSRALKDAMHGINLGVAQHACGNVLYEDVVRNCRLVKNYDEHLHKFWNTHKSWCRDRKLSTSIAQFSLAGINKRIIDRTRTPCSMQKPRIPGS